MMQRVTPAVSRYSETKLSAYVVKAVLTDED